MLFCIVWYTWYCCHKGAPLKKDVGFVDFFKKKLEYLTAILCFGLFLLVSLTVGGQKVELGMYDTMLKIKPEISQRPEILLVDIDDESIEQIGAFPWTRDVIADALIRLREVGGKQIVFDIEYLTPGQAGVNRNYVKTEFPAEYNSVHTNITDYLGQLTDAIATGGIPVDAVPDYGSQISQSIDEWMNDLSNSITGNIFRDNDEYFANAIGFFGKTYLTINYERINTKDDTNIVDKYARDHLLFTKVEDPAGLIVRENAERRKSSEYGKGIAPAILPLISRAAGAGFPNVIIDEDGVRRRIELLAEYDGAYVGQLVFSPILDILEPEKIVRRGQTLVLVNARSPSALGSDQRKNISIPLDEKGRLLINWLKRGYTNAQNPGSASFRHMSVFALKLCDDFEQTLLEGLSVIKGLGIHGAQGFLSYDAEVTRLLSSYQDLNAWKQSLLSGEKKDFSEYFAARKEFFSQYGKFLDGGYDTEIYGEMSRHVELTGDSRYTEYSESVRKIFDTCRGNYAKYLKQVDDLTGQCNGSFCIIGWSGVGTSDLGVNPFQKSYPNVGTHANIYNTIMSEQFIMPMPRWVSWLFALACCFISALAFRWIKSLKGRIAYGVVSSVMVFVLITFVFIFFRVYVQVFVPLLSVILTFLMVSILKFVFSEQEKSFLRKAFTTYLSSDVVDEIVNNPSLLKLGGQEKRITALFTDIKGFSTLSEKITPEHLVQILNKYLTVMSNIVLDQKGTIDKYEGDAIMAFFGAPLDLPDHASRACLSAVRMKEAEARLNEELLANNETPSPIFTRIGINTGPMVVGNMGTDNKMNYTIMGNDVNLAARLEGVNKSYATWILVSESTWSETNGQFLGRKLDRVRVVGINTPVQLYNVMAVRSEASGKMVALVDKFDQAIDAYREKRLGDALLLFTKCTEIDPDDAASRIFLERIQALVRDGLPADWSDVINMTSK